MRSDELRRRYLRFFADRGHTVFPSDSLVPDGDASILFTGAGMNQFKDAFLGKGPKDLKRATSCQKCLRMPDLDNVGRTPSHHTFFEMLGNFSFGDYFKRDAILWAVEFLEKELSIPRESLAVTVFIEDDEAAAIWEKDAGFARGRIFRYGEQDNFWPAEAPSKGPNGPCGPCSEIYFDFDPKAGDPPPGRGPAEDSRRFVEVWNLVFTQFDRKDVNRLEPLPRKNIDTGMGFERMARVLQGKPSNFETDLFVPLLEHVGERTGKRYGKDPQDDVRMKRIADHVRAATFCITDGVRPGNEGRGYVVRKVIRRAAMDLRELGLAQEGLYGLVPVLAAVMGEAYPELRERQGLASDTIRLEEERFAEVWRAGSEKLRVFLDQLDAKGSKTLDGARAFFLWDTSGFPFDLTKRYCEDHGYAVDEAGFEREMEAQRSRAREGSQISDAIFDTGPTAKLKGRVEPTQFTGYEGLEGEATIVALLGDDGEPRERLEQGERGVVVLDRSPFYGESGGQVGDAGSIEVASGKGRARVLDTRKASGFHLHQVEVDGGGLAAGERATARVDTARRSDIMRNHTATHLLHWALRNVLGSDVTQAGSLVHPDYLRFDYTARGAPSRAQLDEIEDLVNAKVLADLEVRKTESSFDEARAEGAIALFGEKYGSRVRVVRVIENDDASVELCGGTHCDRTGQIGLFKIVSDGAIAAGVRRIVAVTGTGAIKAVRDKFALVQDLTERLKAREDEIPARLDLLVGERKRLEKEVAKAKRESARGAIDAIRAARRDLGGGSLYASKIDGLGTDELRALADDLLRGDPAAVAVLVGVDAERASIVVACGDDAIRRGVKAGNLCRELGKQLGGGGGGRPQMAQGQGCDVAAVDGALVRLAGAIAETWAET